MMSYLTFDINNLQFKRGKVSKSTVNTSNLSLNLPFPFEEFAQHLWCDFSSAISINQAS